MLNVSHRFFIVFFWQVYTSTHWDAKTKTTTYCHIWLDGLNAEQVQMFQDWFSFAGICWHTVIDRPSHHHTVTLLTWCSWCWTLWCVSSFNYVNRRQFTHTNTKCNSYLRNDSCCYREEYNMHLKLNRLTKKQYNHAKHQHWCFKMGVAPFFKHHAKLHNLNITMRFSMIEQVWINVSQCRGVLILLKIWVNSQKLGVQAPQNVGFE